MNAKLEQLTKTRVKLTIVADKSEIATVKKEAMESLRPRVKSQGFREGKAPDAIVEKQLGSDVVQAEVLDGALRHLYAKAAVEHDVRVVGDPDVKVTKFVPYSALEFEIEVDVFPEVKLPDYKKMKLDFTATEIKDKDIQEVLDDLAKRQAERVEVDRALKSGDEATIDFKGMHGDKPLPGGSATNYPLAIGSNSFIPGFEEELVGLKKTNEKTFDITFPEDYGEKSLQGEEVTFEVKIKKVSELNSPKIDDEFAKSLGPFDSLDDLKKDIEGQLKTDAESREKRDAETKLVKEIVEKSKLELPESLIEKQKEDIAKNMPEDTDEKIIQAEAEERVRTGLVLAELSRVENIEVSESDIDARLNLYRMQYQDPKMQEQLLGHDARAEIEHQLRTEKTIDKLVGYTTKGEKKKN